MTEPKQRRGLDPELQAMAKIDRLLSGLEPTAALRCVDWAKKYAERRWANADDVPKAANNDEPK